MGYDSRRGLPERPPLPARPPYYLVRVSGMYVGPGNWLVGHPAKALIFGRTGEAFALMRTVIHAKLWTGRIRVVRRKTLDASQW